jgi:hypothetical protein
LTQRREFFFSVPADYHVHNDLVAAALMAVMGQGFRSARFNFPISARCAALLPSYHRLEQVGPVDPNLEPRRPGRYLGLAFSGGLDSVSVWTMLRDVVGMDFKVITGEYDRFHREAVGYASYRRDVSCWTNFRRVVGDRGRRFDAAIPLLFADYADLESFTTGHTFGTLPLLWNDPSGPEPPEFLEQDAVAAAGGLKEVHILRSLHEPGVLQFLFATAPERIESAFHVTSSPGSSKYLNKALMLRRAYHKAGEPLPAFLEEIVWPDEGGRRWAAMQPDNWIAWRWKYLDQDTVFRMGSRVGQLNWSPLSGMSLAFYDKYLPPLARLIPESFRETLLAGFRAAGISPYEPQDYVELEAVRQFILAVNPPGSITFE